jgi:hypothetical protein
MLVMCELGLLPFEKIACFFNPDMKGVALKLPPRKSPDKIACRFWFKLVPSA